MTAESSFQIRGRIKEIGGKNEGNRRSKREREKESKGFSPIQSAPEENICLMLYSGNDLLT